MKNKIIYKVVSIETVFGERIICIVLEEDKDKYYYKSKSCEGYIFKEDIKELAIIGDVIE